VLQKAIEEAYDLGLEDVLIAGGEPLMERNLIIRIIRLLNRMGVNSRLETNGTLVDEELARSFSKYDVHVSMSLDSAHSTFFDSFRGVAGTFDAVVKTTKLLTKHSVPTRLVMVVTKSNLKDVEESVDFMFDLGVNSVRINPVHAVGRAKNFSEVVDTKDLKVLADKLVMLYEEYPTRLITSLPLCLIITHGSKYARLAEGHCNYKELLGILPNGEVSLCAVGLHSSELLLGNIFRESLKNIWASSRGFLGELRSLAPEDFSGVCGRCVFRHYCANKCPAEVYLTHRTFKASYPICQSLYDAGLFPQTLLL